MNILMRTGIPVLILLLVATGFATTDSPHGKLDIPCESCHTPTSFTDVAYDHDRTSFMLEGSHSSAECTACHSIKDFAEVASSCNSCHEDVHEAKLGPDCTNCHTSQGWTVFDVEEIHLETSFPLMGRHAMLDCQGCHKGLPRGDLSFNTTRCEGCHQQNYLEVISPNHVASGFSTECQDCHQTNSWKPANLVDHDAFFPIFSGNHQGTWDGCNTCHINPGSFNDFSCLSCHEHEQTTTDANHAGITGYTYNSSDCYLCHPTGTKGSFITHDAQFFPIFSGTHQGKWDECKTCHTSPINRSVVNCLSCHEHNQSLMDSKHSGISGYSYNSQDCFLCHPTGQKGQFGQHDAQFFPIFSGTHQGQWDQCATCHVSQSDRRVFECINCHEHRQTLTDSRHQNITGYSYNSQECYLCHPTGKRGQFVDHDPQFFPIFSGTHQGQWSECTTCHTSPGDRKVFDCLVCHKHAQSTTDQVHQGISGYSYNSQDCYLCHPTGKAGQFVDHDPQFFPIFSGTHQGKWADCSTCHVVAGDRTRFECTTCHEHAQSLMDPKHQGITGYAYNSQDCLLCHPTGVAGQFVDHDPQFFPIFSGTHQGKWTACATCHTSPGDRKVFDCLVCHKHAQSTTDPIHQGIPGYSYNSQDCLLCHPTGKRGKFTDHDAMFFPIFSRKHRGKWGNDCTVCHDVQSDRSQFTCFNCHEHSRTKMDRKHRGRRGYSYDSPTCVGCHPHP